MADEPLNTADQNADKKIEFSAEQQDKIQEIVDRAVGRNANKLRTDYEAKITDAQRELAEAKDALKNAKTTATKADAKGDVAALEAKIAEMETVQRSVNTEVQRLRDENVRTKQDADAARKEKLNLQKRYSITSAASKFNFVNPDVVVKLTEDEVQYDGDTGRFVVLNESGQPKLNAAYEPMTLDEFYTDYANKNKYLVRGDVKGGTGSTQSDRTDLTSDGKYELKDVFGTKSNAKLANQLALKNPAEYKRLRAIAYSQGLI